MSTFGIFLFVVVQRASVPWLLQRAKVDGTYPFSSNSVVVSVTFVEIILGVSIACFASGLRRGIVETLHPRELKKWFFLGLSQAVSDMLELYANKYLDASTYQVLLQSKLLVTALLMTTVTKSAAKQSSLEWLLLIALSLGLTTYSILSNGSGSFSAFGTVLALIKVLLSCTNAVFTEQILKQSDGTPVVHQIVHMKVFWCLWSVVCMAFLEGPSVYAPARFFHGWGLPVLLVMATYVVKNWSGTFVLKRLDSLRKNIAEAFAMLMLYLLEISPFFGKKALEMPTLCVTVMVVLLVWSYLESKQRSLQKTTGKRMGFTEFFNNPSLYGTGGGSPLWQRRGRRLGRKYGLLPTHSVTTMSQRAGRVVVNKNAGAGVTSMESLPGLPLHKVSTSPSLLNSLVDGSGVIDLEGPRVVSSMSTEEPFGLLDNVQALLQAAVDGAPGTDWRTSVSKALGICKGLKPYLEAMSSQLSPAVQAITDATRNTDWAALHAAGETRGLYNQSMMTTQVQGQMLSFFCSMLGAQRILEVGMFTGFSTLCMAEASPHCRVKAIEYDPYLVGVARRHFDRSPHGHKIEIVCGDARDVLGGMGVAINDESRFDLIFIDGNKLQYADYFRYINDQDLLAPGGLICIDETLWKGCVYSSGSGNDDEVAAAMRELNTAISSDPKLVSVVLPIRNGLTLVRRLDDQIAGERGDHFSAQTPLFQYSRPKRGRAVTQQDRGARSPKSKSDSGDDFEALPDVPLPGRDVAHGGHGAGDPRQYSVESTDLDLAGLDGLTDRMQTC